MKELKRIEVFDNIVKDFFHLRSEGGFFRPSDSDIETFFKNGNCLYASGVLVSSKDEMKEIENHIIKHIGISEEKYASGIKWCHIRTGNKSADCIEDIVEASDSFNDESMKISAIYDASLNFSEKKVYFMVSMPGI